MHSSLSYGKNEVCGNRNVFCLTFSTYHTYPSSYKSLVFGAKGIQFMFVTYITNKIKIILLYRCFA